MTKKDFSILSLAIASAQVVVNEYHFSRSRKADKVYYLVSFSFQGVACKFEIAANSEEEARKEALAWAKGRFNKRFTRGITRRELDAPALESQRHLLFWRDHIHDYESLRRYQALYNAVPPYREDPAAFRRADDAAARFYRRYCPNIHGYNLDKLLEQYEKVPLSWLKAAKVVGNVA